MSQRLTGSAEVCDHSHPPPQGAGGSAPERLEQRGWQLRLRVLAGY